MYLVLTCCWACGNVLCSSRKLIWWQINYITNELFLFNKFWSKLPHAVEKHCFPTVFPMQWYNPVRWRELTVQKQSQKAWMGFDLKSFGDLFANVGNNGTIQIPTAWAGSSSWFMSLKQVCFPLMVAHYISFSTRESPAWAVSLP